MGRQKSQIEEVAREIAHVSSALQDLYATLGEYALHHNQTAITDETKAFTIILLLLFIKVILYKLVLRLFEISIPRYLMAITV